MISLILGLYASEPAPTSSIKSYVRSLSRIAIVTGLAWTFFSVGTSAENGRHMLDSQNLDLGKSRTAASRLFNTRADIPVGNCSFYYEYLANNAIAYSFLQNTSCPVPGNYSYMLDLRAKSINATDMKILAPALQQLTTLGSLYLDNNNIGDIGTMDIASVLQHLSLMYLSLNNNNISFVGVEALVNAIQNEVAIYGYGGVGALSLNNNNIGDNGAEVLSSLLGFSPGADGSTPNLFDLYLSNSSIGISGAVALAANMSNVLSLDLANNNIDTAGAEAMSLSLWQQAFWMTSLNIYNNSIGNFGARSFINAFKFSDILQLRYLNASSNGISDDTCAFLMETVRKKSPKALIYCD